MGQQAEQRSFRERAPWRYRFSLQGYEPERS